MANLFGKWIFNEIIYSISFLKFDGIHKGHQLLLNALLEKKKQGLKTVVFTFFVPPIPGREDVRQLTPNDEKKKFLEAYGIDYLIEYPFTEKVRHTAPKDFIQEILCKKLCAAFVASWYNFFPSIFFAEYIGGI